MVATVYSLIIVDSCLFSFQNSVAQLPLEELDRIQEYLQSSGLAQR